MTDEEIAAAYLLMFGHKYLWSAGWGDGEREFCCVISEAKKWHTPSEVIVRVRKHVNPRRYRRESS